MPENHLLHEDEIELIDLLRVIAKWKMFIVTGTLAFGLAALLFSFQLPKIYESEMTIQPGVLKIENNGHKLFVDSVKKIAGRIGAGLYDKGIQAEILKNGFSVEDPEIFEFDVSIPVDSDVLHISYESEDLKKGRKVLLFLFDLLLENENFLLKGLIESYNYKISLKKNEIEKSQLIIMSYEKNKKEINRRIQEINADIDVMKKNSLFLSSERKKLFEKKADAEGSLSVLLYSSTIQQGVQFVNTAKNNLNGHQRKIKEEELKIIAEKNRQENLGHSIYSLEKERDSVTKMKILIHPDNNRINIVKPDKKMIVLLCLISGFLLCLFCAFLLEYLVNNKMIEFKK